MSRKECSVHQRSVKDQGFGRWRLHARLWAIATLWILVFVLNAPCVKAVEEAIFEDDFSDAPFSAMASALSHIYYNDPVFARTNRQWESTGGSSNGYPFWVAKEGNTGYMFENPHTPDWGPNYYYSGIMSQWGLRLEPGYLYIVELDMSVDQWYELSRGGANTNKVQTDLDGSGAPLLSLYSSFNKFGGTNVIRMSEDGVAWEELASDGWAEPLDLGTGSFTQTFMIEARRDLLVFDFYLTRGDGSTFKYLSIETTDPRALALLGTPLRLTIQCPQDKGPYAPERNFKLRYVNVVRERL